MILERRAPEAETLSDLIGKILTPQHDSIPDKKTRAQAALTLAFALTDAYPAIPVPATQIHRLDTAMPDLLRTSPVLDLGPILALCAALSNRLSNACLL